MSDLHKEILKKQAKQKPPIPKNFQDDDSNDSEEELDKFEIQQQEEVTPPVKLQGGKPVPIKANHNLPLSHHQNPQQNVQTKKKIHDYSPLKWDCFFDELIYHPNGTPIYIAGKNKAPIFFCLHGAGHSAMSFANLALEIKQFACIISFDYRGHGLSKFDNETVTLDINTLMADSWNILEYITNMYPSQTVIIVGHSMGGAVASKLTQKILAEQKTEKVQGLIVIDVVEGTAVEALPFMEQIVNNRPKFFKNYEQAIQWSLNSSTLMTLQSAKISIPYQLAEIRDEKGELIKLSWRVDLLKTSAYWLGWFEKLTDSFLSVRIPKILMLAEKERLDKDLTVAQMQGKFRLVILQNTGHSIQEDDPKSSAYNFHDFILKFRIPTTVQELAKLKQIGIGKFHPQIEPYDYQAKYY